MSTPTRTFRAVVRDALMLDTLDEPTEVADRRDRGGLRRVVASGSVSLTGLALLVPHLTHLGGGPLLGLSLAVIGSLVSFGLFLVGIALARSGFTTTNVVRISVWNLLGVVVLGSVMVANLVYQTQLGTTLRAPTFTVANLLALGAAAHVIIGFYDARRVRAEQLARERQKIAVLNRVIRHNLRNSATVLQGHGDILADGVDDEELANSARVVSRHAATIGSLADNAKEIIRIYDRGAVDYEAYNVRALVEDAAAEAARTYPDAAVTVDVADGDAEYWVDADSDLSLALEELVENAVEHNGSETPTVDLSLTADDDWVTVGVSDDGPGIPAHEKAVLTGEAELTQLRHGSGLGLWVVRAVADVSRGVLGFEESATGGSRVTLRLRRSRSPQ
ncbi:Signal transduction histidine kinase [Halogranum amylolyticum]|uniref:histidine kinase n=1 Tax=Halogranum amylolyticum TaxID=660520 RepID=A0A1H8TCB9_9EURY|nr:HAMP domain-containing sensor histidine kinase [Halogranum amylolyticum]SEO88234.1 Signal transduction histidine kinase [Halogranum amylolyticum]